MIMLNYNRNIENIDVRIGLYELNTYMAKKRVDYAKP